MFLLSFVLLLPEHLIHLQVHKLPGRVALSGGAGVRNDGGQGGGAPQVVVNPLRDLAGGAGGAGGVVVRLRG